MKKMDCDAAGRNQEMCDEISNETKSTLIKVGWKKMNTPVLLVSVWMCDNVDESDNMPWWRVRKISFRQLSSTWARCVM